MFTTVYTNNTQAKDKLNTNIHKTVDIKTINSVKINNILNKRKFLLPINTDLKYFSKNLTGTRIRDQ